MSRTESMSGVNSLNLSLTSKMVSLLLRSYENKLSRNRLIECLWPEELFSFDSLELRLTNLLKEARNKNFNIILADGYIQLESSGNLPFVLYHPSISIQGFDFFCENIKTTFKRADIEAYYKVSRPHANRILTKWLDEGLIEQAQHYCYSVSNKVEKLEIYVHSRVES